MRRLLGLVWLILAVGGCVRLPEVRALVSPVGDVQSGGLRYRYFWPLWLGGSDGDGFVISRPTRTPTSTAIRTATRTSTATAAATWPATTTRTASPTATRTATRTASPTATAMATHTSTPTVTPAAIPTVRPAGKLGLGGCPASCAALGCSWCYSWMPQPGVGPDHERVPMIWGRDDVGATPIGNSIWLMGFNEPDLSGQANLSVDAAAVLWREVERLYPDRKLVAPAPSDLWIGWLPAFRSAYFARYGAWPRLDALAFHCYRSANECIAIGQQFVAWARAWQVREVWCTEFAYVRAWYADPEGEARRLVAWLEGEPMVTRYAPFVSFVRGGEWWWPDTRPEANPSVLTESGDLTAIGRWYARR